MKTHGGKRKGAGRPRTSELVRVTFALMPETIRQIDALAKSRGCSKAQAVAIAINELAE